MAFFKNSVAKITIKVTGIAFAILTVFNVFWAAQLTNVTIISFVPALFTGALTIISLITSLVWLRGSNG